MRGEIPGLTQGELVRNAMSMTDPIADMLTRIRNGQTAGQERCRMLASERQARRSPRCSKQEGYIADVAAGRASAARPR